MMVCYFDSLLWLLLIAAGYSQQAPFANVPKFDKSQNFRTNMCERQRQLWNGTIEFPNALKDLNLTVSITNYQSGMEQNFFTLVDGKIKTEYPGYYAVILDELASRAGFQWRNSFVAVEPRDDKANETWTDILLWTIEVFDISFEKWGQSLDRIAAGASFPLGFWDSSSILVELLEHSQEKRVVNLWSFLEPFEFSVWFMILVAIVFTGFVYWVLEHWNMDTDELSLETKPLASIFYAAITATGHYELKPNTHAARILGFSFSFWALIVASAYTANLASFLVSPKVAFYKYSTMEQVLAKKAVLCMQGGGILEKITKERYPDAIIVEKNTEEAIFAGLRIPIEDGGCNAVLHQFNSYDIFERTRQVNYDCAISSEKIVVENLAAGLATAVDTGGYRCTSLISHVLDYHLTDMVNDGFLERAWKDHLERTGNILCIKPNSNNGGGFQDATSSLTVQDVGGIFIVHVSLSLLAVGLATYHFIQKARKGRLRDDSATLSDIYGITQVRAKSQKLINMLSSANVVNNSYGASARHTDDQPAENSELASTNYKTEGSENDNDLLRNSYIPEENPVFKNVENEETEETVA